MSSNVWAMNFSHDVLAICSLHGAPVPKQQTRTYEGFGVEVEDIVNGANLAVNPFYARAKLALNPSYGRAKLMPSWSGEPKWLTGHNGIADDMCVS